MTTDRHVLIVDDDAEVRAVLGTALRQKSLIPDEAIDGRSAIDLLRVNRYSVVLLDLMMPGVDGFGVLEMIRTPGSLSPVVLVVSGADRSVVEQVGEDSVHGVIRKPFDPRDVAAIVAACIEIRARNPFETMAMAAFLSTSVMMKQFFEL